MLCGMYLFYYVFEEYMMVCIGVFCIMMWFVVVIFYFGQYFVVMIVFSGVVVFGGFDLLCF